MDGFAIWRMEMPFVAQAMLLGGNLRVGLEDNLHLDREVLTSNAILVTRVKLNRDGKVGGRAQIRTLHAERKYTVRRRPRGGP